MMMTTRRLLSPRPPTSSPGFLTSIPNPSVDHTRVLPSQSPSRYKDAPYRHPLSIFSCSLALTCQTLDPSLPWRGITVWIWARRGRYHSVIATREPFLPWNGIFISHQLLTDKDTRVSSLTVNSNSASNQEFFGNRIPIQTNNLKLLRIVLFHK